MSAARGGHASVVASDKIFVLGGVAKIIVNIDFLDSMEYFEPKENKWFPAAPMLEPRSGLSSGALNGFVYVLGGHNDEHKRIPSVDRYSVEANQWERVSEPFHLVPFQYIQQIRIYLYIFPVFTKLNFLNNFR